MKTALTRYVTPALLALGAMLTIANWYLTPERSRAWALTLAFLACLLVPLWHARRRASQEGGRRRTNDILAGAVGFAALVLVIPLSGKLAYALGAIEDGDLAKRLSMVVVGALLVAVGNAMPKMLPPPSSIACDGAKAQALRRLSGWTWVLTGLAYVVLWLVLSVDMAAAVSTMVVLVGMVAVATQMFRLWRTRRREV